MQTERAGTPARTVTRTATARNVIRDLCLWDDNVYRVVRRKETCLNPLISPEPDDVVSGRAPTHWIDTDVMLEVYSHGDLYREWALVNCTVPPGLARGDPEGRRVRLQGSLWMAMALCRLDASTVTYQHENLRNILRLAPPESEVGGWTSTIVYVLSDGGVFRGWERRMTSIGETLSDRNRDRLITRECVSGPIALVTRDARLTREAIAAGVDATNPETFAERTIAREAARLMFESRLEQAIDRYVARSSLDEWLLRTHAMDRVRQLHEAVWSPLDQPWFLPLPASR